MRRCLCTVATLSFEVTDISLRRLCYSSFGLRGELRQVSRGAVLPSPCSLRYAQRVCFCLLDSPAQLAVRLTRMWRLASAVCVLLVSWLWLMCAAAWASAGRILVWSWYVHVYIMHCILSEPLTFQLVSTACLTSSVGGDVWCTEQIIALNTVYFRYSVARFVGFGVVCVVQLVWAWCVILDWFVLSVRSVDVVFLSLFALSVWWARIAAHFVCRLVVHWD